MKNPSLKLRRFTDPILSDPAYTEALSQPGLENMTQHERHAARRKALATAALSLSQEREQEQGPNDLDAHVFELISKTGGFYQSQCDLDDFRRDTAGTRWHDIPEQDRAQFRTARKTLTSFNHTLREVISLGSSKFTFDELVMFITNIHIENGGLRSADNFHQMARSAVMGMRTEVAIEEILIHAGIDYKFGTEAEDIKGGDIIVADHGLDFKTSKLTTDKAKAVAASRGENPDEIIWSHIEFEDYNGQLALPEDTYDRIASQLIPDIQQAIGQDAFDLAA